MPVKWGREPMPYRSMTDEELVQLWRDGHDEGELELIRRYLPKIRAYASRFRFSGMERDDLVQEGLIGFIKAISAYRFDHSSGFSAFAGVCFRNSIKSAAAKALGDQNIPLSNYLSLSDDSIGNLPDTLQSSIFVDPEQTVIRKELLDEALSKNSGVLSAFEKRVLTLYLSGCSYGEMAKKLGCSQKSEDNALQRVRRKLKAV